MISNICLFNTYFCFILVLAFKRHTVKVFDIATKMGMNRIKMSNYKEGGTPQEPWCEFLFAMHDDAGFVYRKGK